MATTYTPNYNFAQPEIGGEPDTWGGLLNVNFGTLDSTIKAVSDVADAAFPKAGGTLAGNLTLAPVSGGVNAVLRAAAGGSARWLVGQTGANNRWVLALGNDTAEGGSNAGSNFALSRYNDAGTLIDSPISIVRSSGAITLNSPVSVSGVLTTSGTIVSAGSDHQLAAGGGAIFLRPAGDGVTTGQTVLQSNIANFNTNVIVAGGNDTSVQLNPSAAGKSIRLASTITPQWGIYNVTDTAWDLRFAGSGGAFFRTQVSAPDFQATSDERLKTDIAPLRNATERLRGMRPRTYRKEGRPEAGFIAQEVQRQLATAVSERDDGYLTVSISQLGALVAAAVLELDERLSALELV